MQLPKRRYQLYISRHSGVRRIQSSNLLCFVQRIARELQASDNHHVLVHFRQLVLCDIHLQTQWLEIVRLESLLRQVDGEVFIAGFRDF